MTGADLSAYGLAKCRRCRRVLTQASLDKGRCKPGNDCGAFEAMAKAWAETPPESCPLFARGVEVALLEAQGLAVGEDGFSEGARAMVDSFALAI